MNTETKKTAQAIKNPASVKDMKNPSLTAWYFWTVL